VGHDGIEVSAPRNPAASRRISIARARQEGEHGHNFQREKTGFDDQLRERDDAGRPS
jgi:hypothetical protein